MSQIVDDNNWHVSPALRTALRPLREQGEEARSAARTRAAADKVVARHATAEAWRLARETAHAEQRAGDLTGAAYYRT